MTNLNIRLTVSNSGVTYKEIAEVLGISRSYLSRLMSKPLSVKNELRILEAIERIKER